MRIASLHSYPIKGSHRNDHDVALVERHGLAGDRRWIVVDQDGVGVTQRDTALLSQLHVTPVGGGLVVRAAGMPDLRLAEPVDGPKEFVRVFKSKPQAPTRLADDGGWFATFLGRPARIAWQEDPGGRPILDAGRDDDRVSMADGYPMLITTEASLAALNDWLVEAGEEPVPMTRFRPNIVVAGAAPWAEDGWPGRRLMIGEVPFRAARPCARCLVTTIDQETGVKGSQPLKILGRHRNIDGGLMFGLNLIPDAVGSLRVGDPVTLAS
ncbi:MOSC N-terminal beta barrel domain-containing protein [Actinoplanes sp. NPDC051470]|uniref:MOSC domain-containing protein n=1 Tax=Actinoplanes sp. NPDC051470 TaxID=3157224 RepID=UPI00342FF396